MGKQIVVYPYNQLDSTIKRDELLKCSVKLNDSQNY